VASGEGAGCLLPPHPALGLGLRPSPLTQNRRLGPSQRGGLDPLIVLCYMHSGGFTTAVYVATTPASDGGAVVY